MIQRLRWICIAAACLLAPACFGAQEERSLARIDTSGVVSAFPLPIYAQLQDASGQAYVLVKATPEELARSGLAFQILDAHSESAAYVLAFEFKSGARQSAQGPFDILHDDGRRLIIRAATEDDVERLAALGFQCRPLPSTPLDLAASAKFAPPRRLAFASNATVSAMMAQVKQTDLVSALNNLTGVQSVLAGGSYAKILTRHLNSGVPLQRATALAHDRLGAPGLQSSYQAWSLDGRSNRNVVGVRPGTTAPSEIVVVCAHIDDMPASGNAPGADDNASGSAGVLAAAEILRKYSFERTLRFVLFTGEEQGLYGSEAYARQAQAAGDRIVAVVNLDMVAWDGNGDGVLHLYVRPTSDSGYAGDRSIAAIFTNVVRTYGLRPGLAPRIIAEVSDWSDHYSFTSHGYPAICAIEEDVDDLNPYYHTASDTVAKLNLPFYTRFVQAAVGTVAHLARPVSGPAITLSPSSRTHSPVAATGRTFSVSATVPWTATDNQPWIAVTRGNSGSGNGSVTYSVSAHFGVTSRTGTITVSGSGLARTFAITQVAGDAYEPDDSKNTAKKTVNGRTQPRSIHAAGNADLARFVVDGAGARNVRIETSGASGNTQLWLYRNNGALVAYDDNSGPGYFSRIAVSALPPGTYYVKVKEYGNNGTIPDYALRVSWTP